VKPAGLVLAGFALVKRRTYTRLRLLALSALLIEAVLLLVLLLAQNGASAAVNDFMRLSRNGTAWFSGHSDKQKTTTVKKSGKPADCNQSYFPCGAGGDAVDIADEAVGGAVDSVPAGTDGVSDLGHGDTPDGPRLAGGPPFGPFLGFPDGLPSGDGAPGNDGSPPGGGPGHTGDGGPGNGNQDGPGSGNPGGGGPGDGGPGGFTGPIIPFDLPPISDGATGGDPPPPSGDPPPSTPTTLAVPEPFSAPIFIAGLAALWSSRRRKRTAG
jgi:hypothetical protein